MASAIVVDRFAIYFWYLFLAGTAITVLMSVRYLEIEHENHGEFYTLMLLSVVGMMCMAAGLRHRADLHRPGVDGDLHLRARRIPAARPPLQRSRAEVSATGRVFIRHLCLWLVAALRPDRKHKPGADQQSPRRHSRQRPPQSRCHRRPADHDRPACCSRSPPSLSINGRRTPTKARPPASPASCPLPSKPQDGRCCCAFCSWGLAVPCVRSRCPCWFSFPSPP